MHKAYIILAHKNPEQLCRLVRALSDENSYFFIHVDSRANLRQFECLASFRERIHYVDRVKTSWGSFGIVEATLNGLRAVKSTNQTFDSIILLSGQDYPIKSNEQIDEFIRRKRDHIFLNWHQLPDRGKWNPDGGLYRVNKYFMGFRPHQKYAARALNFSSRMLPLLRRKQYLNMQPYAGSMWWIINSRAMDYILQFVEKHPRYAAFHRFTFAADELFFHMILLNATDEAITSMIVNDDKRFLVWKDKDASHPEILYKEDIDALKNSNALFARKFDVHTDADLFDLVDEHRAAGK